MSITAEEFDKVFDEGKEDILQYCDMEHVTRPNLEKRSVLIDLPAPAAKILEAQARDLDITIEDLLSKMAVEKAGESSHA